MTDIVDKLEDLLKQATTERSHYYVASCCREAIAEIKRLRSDPVTVSRQELADLCNKAWKYDGLCK